MSNFTHIQTAHCENGVTVGLLNKQGLEFMNEPLALGIGSGLFYIHIPLLKILMSSRHTNNIQTHRQEYQNEAKQHKTKQRKARQDKTRQDKTNKQTNKHTTT